MDLLTELLWHREFLIWLQQLHIAIIITRKKCLNNLYVGGLCARYGAADCRWQTVPGCRRVSLSLCFVLLQYDLSTTIFWGFFYRSAELVPSQMCGHNFATGTNTPLFPDRRWLLNPALVTSGWSWMFFQPEAQNTHDSPSLRPKKKHCWCAAFVLHGGQSLQKIIDLWMKVSTSFFSKFPFFLPSWIFPDIILFTSFHLCNWGSPDVPAGDRRSLWGRCSVLFRLNHWKRETFDIPQLYLLLSQSVSQNTLLIPEGKLRFIQSLQDIKHTHSIEELYRKIKKERLKK